jgi:hypothetical protein
MDLSFSISKFKSDEERNRTWKKVNKQAVNINEHIELTVDVPHNKRITPVMDVFV